ncbi:hypothetical protein HAX54_009626 [Datura stramonium]|uniref:Uncharacterized protein n=1 Tax=Datura stramonium TaxID=4076 RepID=A0ABS8WZL3_DATST|nr:hypothetical protein [Datura stramonium]
MIDSNAKTNTCWVDGILKGTMTSPIKKKQQEAVARKEIAKRRQLHDELELDSSSGSEFDERSDEAESNGDNPPTNNAEKTNDDSEESGDDDTNVEESGDKDNAAEESNEQVEDSEPGTTPEARSKRWFIQGSRDVYFVGLNLNEKGNPSRSKYNMEMVHEFYANYYCNLEKKASSKKAIKKEPVLDSVRIRDIPGDISERTITRALMGGDFTLSTKTTEYDYRMEAMKGIKNLRTVDKVFHFQWMANILLKTRREQNVSQAEN